MSINTTKSQYPHLVIRDQINKTEDEEALTNRQWLASLSKRELANFVVNLMNNTCLMCIEKNHCITGNCQAGICLWLDKIHDPKYDEFCLDPVD